MNEDPPVWMICGLDTTDFDVSGQLIDASSSEIHQIRDLVVTGGETVEDAVLQIIPPEEQNE